MLNWAARLSIHTIKHTSHWICSIVMVALLLMIRQIPYYTHTDKREGSLGCPHFVLIFNIGIVFSLSLRDCIFVDCREVMIFSLRPLKAIVDLLANQTIGWFSRQIRLWWEFCNVICNRTKEPKTLNSIFLCEPTKVSYTFV